MAIKTIAIIGATGDIGSSLIRSLSEKKNHRLLLVSHDQKKLMDLKVALDESAPDTETLVIDCARDACWEADIIILATPIGTEKEIAEKIREVATGKIVISISNPYSSSCTNVVTSRETNDAEEFQNLLSNSILVKLTNTISAIDNATTAAYDKNSNAFFVANNSDAFEMAKELTNALGSTTPVTLT